MGRQNCKGMGMDNQDQRKDRLMAASNEQLEKETAQLFNKFEEQTKLVTDLRLQLNSLDGRMDTLVRLMQDALANLPSAYEHGLKYDQACERIQRIENAYVNKEEFKQFREDFNKLSNDMRESQESQRKWAMVVAGAFLVPLAGIAVKVIFGG